MECNYRIIVFWILINVCTLRAHVFFETVVSALHSYAYISPKQVVGLLWMLPCKDTNAYMKELIQCYNKPGYNYQKNSTFVQHCRSVHGVLKYLYVDEKWQALVYKEQAPPAHLPTLVNYWRRNQQYAYLDFYRLYADALSVVIIKVAHEAYVSLGDPEWKSYGVRLQVYFNEYKEIVQFFSHTEYEVVYTQALHRYQELIALLKAEQTKQGYLLEVLSWDHENSFKE